MTIKELKIKIEKLPDDMLVFVTQDNLNYDTVMAESARKETLNFDSLGSFEAFVIND